MIYIIVYKISKNREKKKVYKTRLAIQIQIRYSESGTNKCKEIKRKGKAVARKNSNYLNGFCFLKETY